MCGIFGFISRKRRSAGVLAAMSRLIRHRGPDGEGFALFSGKEDVQVLGGADTPDNTFGNGLPDTPVGLLKLGAESQHARIGLGHRRLAIVELSHLGHQPMTDSDRSLWIVFNGEIYNHIELRAELEGLGVSFRSHSDTEVIIASYRQWGIECLSRFNGMFAFVLYDLRQDKIFSARDRFGVKPLHFWSDGETFLFASEVKAFLGYQGFSVDVDPKRVRDYLTNGPSNYEPQSIFGKVQQLSPGCFAYGAPEDFVDGSFQEKRWWTLTPNPSKEAFDERTAASLSEQYRHLLEDAVAIRLRADVPVGSALSGGLDSSSIVYLVSEILRASGKELRQETFSSIYTAAETKDCDESEYIFAIAAQLGLSPNTIEPKAVDIPQMHQSMIWHLDFPPETTLMSSWNTFKLVQSSGIKVTLDGQGADEQLGGYLSYLPHAFSKQPARQLLNQVTGALRMHPLDKVAGAIAFGFGTPLLNAFAGALHVRHRRVLGQVEGGLNAALVEDCFTGLSNLIHYGDRTSMAFSVESRMPFLDFRLAEFLASVPEAYKLHSGWTKFLARRAFSARLPDDVVWRKDKMGWPTPDLAWEKGPLKTWFDHAYSQADRLAPLGARDEFERCVRSPRITERVRAVNILSWLDTFVEGGWKNLALSH